MERVAIDLGGRKSLGCVRDATGKILERKRWPTRKLEAYLRTRSVNRDVRGGVLDRGCHAEAP